jgi:uncharacterized protein YcfJ
MNATLRNVLGVAGLVVATQAGADITFYEHDGFHGQTFTTDRPIGNLQRFGFNDRASSVVVRGERWEVCEDAQFSGRCVVLRPGNYPSLGSMGLNDRVSSMRAIPRHAALDDPRYGAGYAPDNEPLYTVNVSSVRAVVGPPEQRCWIEREQYVERRGDATVPGAIVGAVIGGVLGHQIGGGRGKDAATAGGAVGGAVIGGNLGRQSGGDEVMTRDVQHCANVSNPGKVAYWDVTYWFRGQEHRVQLTYPPGPTLAVNAQGEPRA